MGEPIPRPAEEEADARYRAIVALSAWNPDYGVPPDRLPEDLRGRDVGADLRLLTEAPPDEVSVSTRLAVLYDLARGGFPQQGLIAEAYRGLAASAVAERSLRDAVPVDPDDLLEDIAISAGEGVPLSTRDRTRAAFAHFELAFIGRRVCTTQRVEVDGVPAVWIYSEFETDASFEHVATWLDPRRWSEWGPLFFRRMELLGPADPLPLAPPPVGDPHWHGLFHEEVQLVRRLHTLLRCTYWRDGGDAAAMTYDLDSSLDDQIDVDRGYLLVTPAGGQRRVQALKIVSFTQDLWDLVALYVCPFWTEFIRGAVRDGTAVQTLDPSQGPGPAPSPVGLAVDEWVRYFGTAVQPYLDLCSGATSRIRSGSYSPSEALLDGTRWWSQFAKDWARAWTNVSETVQDVAERGLDAGFTPPGVPPERARGAARAFTAPAARAAAEQGGTVLTVPGLAAGQHLVCTDLASIGSGSAGIPADEVVLTTEPTAAGATRVRIRTTSATAPPGLYVGRLRGPGNQDLAPVQLYVSRATGA